jgi:hypothetical protein
VCLCPPDTRHCACKGVQEQTGDGSPSIQWVRDAGGESLELKWQPLGGVRTGARHADGGLGGLGSEHCLEGGTSGLRQWWFLFKTKQK